MHRLLLAYETTSVVVWSLNKNKALSVLNAEQLAADKGRVLACEWLGEVEFIVAFAKGHLEIFYEGAKKCHRSLQFPELSEGSYLKMRLALYDRPGAE